MLPHDPHLTLRLDGPRMTSDHFARAVEAFFDLLDEVSRDMTGAGNAVTWIISVKSGSNVLIARPEVEKTRVGAVNLVRTISKGVGLIERRAQRPRHFTDSALRIARELANVPDGQHLRLAQIRSADVDVTVSGKTTAHVNRLLGEDVQEYGTVEGRLQTLSERGRPHFAIYDQLTDRPIRCFVKVEQLQQAWRAFGRRVAVSGMIRYRRTGEPVSIEAETVYVFPPDDELPTADDVYGIMSSLQ